MAMQAVDTPVNAEDMEVDQVCMLFHILVHTPLCYKGIRFGSVLT
jgi:hypothetical protein